MSAAVITQILQRRAERERRAADDARRWHTERFRVCKELLYKVMETTRILWEACAQLPNDEEYERLLQAGHTTMLNVPDGDVPPYSGDALVFSTISLEIIKEALERVHGLLEEAEHLLAEISLLSDGVVPESASIMFETAWSAAGALETTRGSRDEAFQAVIAVKEPISNFQEHVRRELGVTGDAVSPPSRP